MSTKQNWIEKRSELRKSAESILSGLTESRVETSHADMLLHELLIHKVELEVQLEELRAANVSMEMARDCYLDLYNSSPVGYLTVTRDGLLSMFNRTAAAMFGIEYSAYAMARFSSLVALQDRDRWHRLFVSMMDRPENKACSFNLNMLRQDGSIFETRVDCRRQDETGARSTLRVTLFDFSQFIPN